MIDIFFNTLAITSGIVIGLAVSFTVLSILSAATSFVRRLLRRRSRA